MEKLRNQIEKSWKLLPLQVLESQGVALAGSGAFFIPKKLEQ